MSRKILFIALVWNSLNIRKREFQHNEGQNFMSVFRSFQNNHSNLKKVVLIQILVFPIQNIHSNSKLEFQIQNIHSNWISSFQFKMRKKGNSKNLYKRTNCFARDDVIWKRKESGLSVKIDSVIWCTRVRL
jgi:hypothetical protein